MLSELMWTKRSLLMFEKRQPSRMEPLRMRPLKMKKKENSE